MKSIYRIWASRPGEELNGKVFHLRPASMTSLCKILKLNGWNIGQIKAVKNG